MDIIIGRQHFSYDDIGNPTNWYNGQTYTNLTWQNGRELSGLRTGNRNYNRRKHRR